MKKIYDIFNKERVNEKIIEKPKIIIDYREKNSLVASELIELGCEIEFKELKVGDYIVKDTVIERKTVNDFISSMINRRLIKQLYELNQFPNRLLIIEGLDEQELYSENSGINENATRGFLLSILLKFKTPIIYTKDYEDSAKFISILARKREKTNLPLNISKRNLNKKERMQFILESFPGIGPQSAKKLLEKFRNIKNIMNASEEELKSILGKKAEVFKIINEDYNLN